MGTRGGGSEGKRVREHDTRKNKEAKRKVQESYNTLMEKKVKKVKKNTLAI